MLRKSQSGECPQLWPNLLSSYQSCFFFSILPAPSLPVSDRDMDDVSGRFSSHTSVSSSRAAPPYGHRKGWIPRTVEDFGDGGAYPEIHTAQFPMGMGKKKATSNALAVAVDATGKIKYDAIARHGHAQDKVIYSKYTDLVPKQIDQDDPELEKPDEEAIQENTEKTKNALEALVQSKISAAMPVRAADKQAPAQYIRYTPSQQGPAFNSGAKQRIIRMVEAPKDPMEPPRFKWIQFVLSSNSVNDTFCLDWKYAITF